MGNGIYVALSGAVAQETALETTATNLANASTDGYQKARPVFREVLAQTRRGGAMRMTTVGQTAIDTTAGAVRTTGRPLDVALPRGTYLAVSAAAGERYTRAASLRVGAEGLVRAPSGDPVLGVGGQPIRASTTTGEPVTITTTGEVRQGTATLGRLRLVTFARPDALTHEGATLLAAPAAAGTPVASTAPIEVGAIEESNASVVGSMTELVTMSRNFDAFQRAIDAFREADRRVVTTTPAVT